MTYIPNSLSTDYQSKKGNGIAQYMYNINFTFTNALVRDTIILLWTWRTNMIKGKSFNTKFGKAFFLKSNNGACCFFWLPLFQHSSFINPDILDAKNCYIERKVEATDIKTIVDDLSFWLAQKKKVEMKTSSISDKRL